jgi:uncharacterized protein involved in response to NO
MASVRGEVEAVVKQAPFYKGFIWVACAAALGVGFATGAHMAFVMGFGFPLGKGFASFVQVHGHVQLMGWAGLFIMGISLHFIPRLTGVPIAQPLWLSRIAWLMGIGIALRSIGHSVLPSLTGWPVFTLVAWLVVVSGGLEWGGILLYVYLLLSTLRRVGPAKRMALLSVRPFLGMMIAGWLLYACLNLVLLVQMVLSKSVVLPYGWNQFAIQSFTGLVLLPVAFAFSVRTLPLYLRLATPNWSVRGAAYAYLVALAVQVLPTVPLLFTLTPQVMTTISNLGKLCKGGVILWFVWQLDVLTRRRDPWTVQRKLHPGPERRPTRPSLPDYGEFGRFERLVYAAYIWLVIAAFSEIISGITALVARPVLLSNGAIRHMYLLGFITLLIVGMAVRMLPGFLHKKRVMSPALVEATFWFGNVAVVSRVLLPLLPAAILQTLPGVALVARSAFAVSGLLGLVTIGCLAVNIWRTASSTTVF